MKILRSGYRYRSRCKVCECHFECSAAELMDRDVTHKGANYYAICPECETKVRVTRADPPYTCPEDFRMAKIAEPPPRPEVMALVQGWGNSLEETANFTDEADLFMKHADVYSEENLARIVSLGRCLDLPADVSPLPYGPAKPPVPPETRPPFLLLARFNRPSPQSPAEPPSPEPPADSPSTQGPLDTDDLPEPAAEPSTRTPSDDRHTDGTGAGQDRTEDIPYDNAEYDDATRHYAAHDLDSVNHTTGQ